MRTAPWLDGSSGDGQRLCPHRGPRVALNVAKVESRPGPVAAEDLDGPLELAELPRVAAAVRVGDLRPLAERPVDVGLGGPAAAEAVWPHAYVEPEDRERRVEALRLQVELPQIGEDAARLVPALDAEAPVAPSDPGAGPVVAPAGEAEKDVVHADGTRGPDKSLYSRRPRS